MKETLLPIVLPVVAAALLAASFFNPCRAAEPRYENSLGMTMVRIEPGTFTMGTADGDEGNWDERPAHRVTISKPFSMAATEVTNAQYEQFDPDHKQLRGKLGFSKGDDEAVVFVSWNEATAFCRWLSEKEGRTYRLPTEAEWEYACRAGTTTAFHPGESLPKEYLKNPGQSWYPSKPRPSDIVGLEVAQTPPNAWGLSDMHGNVEEWCFDWYGPYEAGEQTDPVGRAEGDFRVTRGGAHSTTPEFLRSANRAGTLPEDKSWVIGFRVVEGDMPATEPLPAAAPPLNARNVSQSVPDDLAEGPDPKEPYFVGPRVYVKEPPEADCPVFNRHNHCPALVNCPNGDLLAIWYTCRTEPGRELGIVGSRLPYGEAEWQMASNFWDAPDRNDHASAFWVDEEGTLYHFNGLSAAATWGSLATVLRTSTDNGATWSKARLIMPEHGQRHMPVESALRTRWDAILLPCDAVPGGHGGTAMLESRAGGKTWTDPGAGRPMPDFAAGQTGAWIAGIHGGFAELADGRLLAFGRGNNIEGQMPRSVSADQGRNWTYSPSPFPPIGGGQRLVILRLAEGPLLFCSFGRAVEFTDASGGRRTGSGLFAALSTDEGRSWQIKRLITDDGPRRVMDGGGNTGRFTMGPNSAEPRGYLSICQTPDGVIHLISSKLHYAFNLAWLNTPAPAEPKPVVLEAKPELEHVDRFKRLPSQSGWRFNGTRAKENEAVELLPEGGVSVKTGPGQRVRWVGKWDDELAATAAENGCTVELTARVTRSTSASRGVDLECYVPGLGRGMISMTKTAVWWYGGPRECIAKGLDNASAPHRYRLALSSRGLVQIFRDGERLAVRAAGPGPDPLAKAEGAYVQWGEGAGGSEADAAFFEICHDGSGAYRP